jgi:Tfp pilus assembly protein PilP
LIIDQVTLKGIVRSQVGPIAVVTGSSNKTFFLRENDPVYNGVVVKITPDSIVFRETVTDRLGKSIQREVVKKVNNPAV